MCRRSFFSEKSRTSKKVDTMKSYIRCYHHVSCKKRPRGLFVIMEYPSQISMNDNDILEFVHDNDLIFTMHYRI